jgi:hypothetical protein
LVKRERLITVVMGGLLERKAELLGVAESREDGYVHVWKAAGRTGGNVAEGEIDVADFQILLVLNPETFVAEPDGMRGRIFQLEKLVLHGAGDRMAAGAVLVFELDNSTGGLPDAISRLTLVPLDMLRKGDRLGVLRGSAPLALTRGKRLLEG